MPRLSDTALHLPRRVERRPGGAVLLDAAAGAPFLQQCNTTLYLAHGGSGARPRARCARDIRAQHGSACCPALHRLRSHAAHSLRNSPQVGRRRYPKADRGAGLAAQDPSSPSRRHSIAYTAHSQQPYIMCTAVLLIITSGGGWYDSHAGDTSGQACQPRTWQQPGVIPHRLSAMYVPSAAVSHL